jgi:hypothetical protein
MRRRDRRWAPQARCRASRWRNVKHRYPRPRLLRGDNYAYQPHTAGRLGMKITKVMNRPTVTRTGQVPAPVAVPGQVHVLLIEDDDGTPCSPGTSVGGIGAGRPEPGPVHHRGQVSLPASAACVLLTLTAGRASVARGALAAENVPQVAVVG